MEHKRSKWTAVLAMIGCLAVAGCGSTNPPCDTDLAEVDAARSAAQSTESQLAALQKERDALEAQIAKEEQRRAELEQRKKELEAKIAELGG
jgi:outer membrane murein-binding lipoprotein Lpp